MLAFMLDTNFCIRVIRGRSLAARARFTEEYGRLCVSTVVVYELLRGAQRSDNPFEGRSQVERFLNRLTVLPFDLDSAAHAADISAVLGNRGLGIGPHDTLIAGHARSRGLVLVTNNVAEFKRVEGLLIEDWVI